MGMRHLGVIGPGFWIMFGPRVGVADSDRWTWDQFGLDALSLSVARHLRARARRFHLSMQCRKRCRWTAQSSKQSQSAPLGLKISAFDP